MSPSTPSLSTRKSSRVKVILTKSPYSEITPANDGNAEAGPSTPSTSSRKRAGAASSSTPTYTGVASQTNGEAPGRRVLPARIRRAAGGGQEGIRDLEEMIVDWLERWGAPCDTPPDSLPIHLTTLPLSMVHPPVQTTSTLPPQPLITLTPTNSNRQPPPPSPRRADEVLDKERIETPGWIVIQPGGDDEEAAREEMQNRVGRSPMKRLRTLHHDEGGEDTSDAHYIALHKKFEVFERRQRIREREKLQFERYKMKSRIDLLRGMSTMSWSTVVNTVLSRTSEPSWEKGRAKLKEVDVDWLRGRLIHEGKELVKRYDELLPVDPRKRTDRANSTATSTPTPERVLEDSPARTLSPPPVLPARVSALREPTSTKRSKPSPAKVASPRISRDVSAPEVKANGTISEYDDPSILLPRKRRRIVVKSLGTERPERLNKGIGQRVTTSHEATVTNAASTAADLTSPTSGRSKLHLSDRHDEVDQDDGVLVPASSPVPSDGGSLSPLTSNDPYSPVKSKRNRPLRPAPQPKKLLPEPTTRRASLAQKVEPVEPPPTERTRSSERLVSALPFGMPYPSTVEAKEDFSITDEEDFWGIIADRETRANELRRASIPQKDSSTRLGGEEHRELNGKNGRSKGFDQDSGPDEGMMSNEDVADMREVEAVVVL